MIEMFLLVRTRAATVPGRVAKTTTRESAVANTRALKCDRVWPERLRRVRLQLNAVRLDDWMNVGKDIAISKSFVLCHWFLSSFMAMLSTFTYWC